MQNNLFFSLILNISFLVLIATILTELRPLRMMLKRQDRSLKNQLVLGVIFGLLSISCTYTGLSFQGAVVNTRVVSTVAAGLVGGPASGICAGVLSGVHRYFYNPAGFTSFACAIGTFLFGVIGAVSYRWFTRRSRRTSDLVFITLVAELVQCGLILLLAKPFSAAAALEESILLPKILVNSLGLVAFMRILDRLNRDLTIELAEQQAVALLIAQECLPYLRRGIKDREGLQCAVNIVREKLPHFQVALTDCTQILAASGGLSSAGPPPALRAGGHCAEPLRRSNGAFRRLRLRRSCSAAASGREGHRRAAAQGPHGAEPRARRRHLHAGEPCQVLLCHAGAG